MTTLASSVSKASSFIDDARGLNYDCHMFIIQATDVSVMKLLFFVTDAEAK
jgi:hypothetical protein